MARETTDRASTTYMHIGKGTGGSVLTGSSAITFACWIYPTNFTPYVGGSANADDVFNFWHSNNTFIQCNLRQDTFSRLNVIYFESRRTSTETKARRMGITEIPLNTWTHIAGIIRYNGSAPDVFFNGEVDNSGSNSITASSGVVQTVASTTLWDAIAEIGQNWNTASRKFQGRIAHMAFWNADIGGKGITELQKYAPPYVRRDALKFYWPLQDQIYSDREYELVDNNFITISGSIVPADGPPIIIRL